MLSTKTNYWIELAIDITLAALLILFGWRHYTANNPMWAILAVVLGLIFFSFVEYFFHRWMFHTRIPLFERGHRMHHENPTGYDSLPFFLPAAISVGLTALCMLIMPTSLAFLFTGTATFGYVLYVTGHFVIHHVRFKQPLLMRWAASHHIHHHHPESNFGVTSPLWDYLLGTRYVRRNANK